jgi:hypothetical protein
VALIEVSIYPLISSACPKRRSKSSDSSQIEQDGTVMMQDYPTTTMWWRRTASQGKVTMSTASKPRQAALSNVVIHQS